MGARGTFWNIRTRRPQTHPGSGFAPWSVNLVGLTTTEPARTDPDGVWFEAIPPEQLHPRNLHEAQRAKRLGRKVP